MQLLTYGFHGYRQEFYVRFKGPEESMHSWLIPDHDRTILTLS